MKSINLLIPTSRLQEIENTCKSKGFIIKIIESRNINSVAEITKRNPTHNIDAQDIFELGRLFEIWCNNNDNNE